MSSSSPLPQLMALLVCFLPLIASGQVIDFSDNEEPPSPPPEVPEKPPEPETERAFVRLLNACHVDMDQPWKSGVDFLFKDESLAVDVRMGEGGGYREIEFLASDRMEVRRHGESKVLVHEACTLEPGHFYTFVVMGQLSTRKADLRLTSLSDAPGQQTPLPGTLRLLNASPTPFQIAIGDARPFIPPAGEWFSGKISSGTTLLRLTFPVSDQESAEIQQQLIAGPNDAYTLIVTQTPHRNSRVRERPRLFIVNETKARADAIRIPEPVDEETGEGGGEATPPAPVTTPPPLEGEISPSPMPTP